MADNTWRIIKREFKVEIRGRNSRAKFSFESILEVKSTLVSEGVCSGVTGSGDKPESYQTTLSYGGGRWGSCR